MHGALTSRLGITLGLKLPKGAHDFPQALAVSRGDGRFSPNDEASCFGWVDKRSVGLTQGIEDLSPEPIVLEEYAPA